MYISHLQLQWEICYDFCPLSVSLPHCIHFNPISAARHQCLQPCLLTCTLSSETSRNLCPLSVCSVSLPHSLHLNPVSGAGLEGGQSVGGVTVGRLGDSDGAILGGVGHSETVTLGVAG